jgi:glycosyltransferase involved in cell wall biosynthesis
MTILNLMLGKGRGGLEQAAIDYAEALALANLKAVTVVSPEAWALTALAGSTLAHETLPNFSAWDPIAAYRLRRRAKRLGTRTVICHGNRALGLALRALKGHLPIIAVAHNYSIRRFVKADACFAITRHLAQQLQREGVPNISLMPNMVRIPADIQRPQNNAPPVIGSMGRMVAKKGFRTFIDACAILRNRNIPYRAILGGDGEEAEAIDSLIRGYTLESQVSRIGWVKDKTRFFESLDLFVLPSYHEPFGIVLIEAMSAGLPVISAKAEGPSEIITDGIHGLLVPLKDAEALADAIATLLANPARATQLAEAGRTHVTTLYSPTAMANRLQTALAPYMYAV